MVFFLVMMLWCIEWFVECYLCELEWIEIECVLVELGECLLVC